MVYLQFILGWENGRADGLPSGSELDQTAEEAVLAPDARPQPANPVVDARGNGCHQPDGGVLQSIFSFKNSGGSLQITSSRHMYIIFLQ